MSPPQPVASGKCESGESYSFERRNLSILHRKVSPFDRVVYTHAMNRPAIELNTFHHIYNRGTDKRIIFLDDEDRERFILYLNVLNNKESDNPSKLSEGGLLKNYFVKERLVELSAFCLMPNHFHFLLFESTKGGISKFMQRLGTAYTSYFNEKYERTGVLFQGVFKSKYIYDEAYLQFLIDYIHLNPKDLRGSRVAGTLKELLNFLDNYEWSSYKFYRSSENKHPFLELRSIEEFLDIKKGYRERLMDMYGVSSDPTDRLDRLIFEE